MGFLIALLPGLLGPILNYFTAAKDAQVAIFQAKTGAASDVAKAAIEAQAQVATKWWWVSIPQTLIGLTVSLYFAKCVLYDKVVASFVGCSGRHPNDCFTFATDPLSSDLNWAFMMVISFYFATAIVDKFLRAK
jgi:hypothetical protein